jgi:large subunit ribosomal protein L21
MYAIIRDGGRQHKVAEGQQLLVDSRDVEPGQAIEFDEIVLLSANDTTHVGTPLVAGAKVVAEAMGPTKGEKIEVQHFRRRKGSGDRTGHRQAYLQVMIKQIVVPEAATAGVDKDA